MIYGQNRKDELAKMTLRGLTELLYHYVLHWGKHQQNCEYAMRMQEPEEECQKS